MAATDKARALEPGYRPLRLGRLRRSSRPVLAAGALSVLVASDVVLALGAAAGPSSLVPSSFAGWPDWLAGPLAGFGTGVSRDVFVDLLIAMSVSYVAVVWLAGAIRSRWVIAAIGALHALFLLAPPLLSGDVFGYLAYARLELVYGLSAYGHSAIAAPADPVFPFVGFRNIPSPYGPLFTLPTLALVPLGVPVGLWSLKAATALASLACVALVWIGSRRLGRDPRRAAILVGLNPLLLVFGVGGAHNDLLMMAAIVAGVVLAIGEREKLGAAAVMAAVGIKASAGLVLPFMLLGLERRRAVLVGAAAGGAAVAVIGLLAFGVNLFSYLEVLGRQGQFISRRSLPNELGLLLGAGGATPVIQAGAMVVFLVVLGMLLVRTRRGADWITSIGWATLVLLLTTTWLWPWYIVWLLPFAALGSSERLQVATLGLTGLIMLTRLPLEVT